MGDAWLRMAWQAVYGQWSYAAAEGRMLGERERETQMHTQIQTRISTRRQTSEHVTRVDIGQVVSSVGWRRAAGGGDVVGVELRVWDGPAWAAALTRPAKRQRWA